MSDTPRPSKHTSRTPARGKGAGGKSAGGTGSGAKGSGIPDAPRKKAAWVGGAGAGGAQSGAKNGGAKKSSGTTKDGAAAKNGDPLTKGDAGAKKSFPGAKGAAAKGAGAKSSGTKSAGTKNSGARGSSGTRAAATLGAVSASGKKLAGGRAAKGGAKTGAAAKSGAASKTGAAAEDRRAARTSAAAAAAGGKRGRLASALNYPRAGRKSPWRWIPSLRLLLGAFALMVLAGVGLTAWVYETTDVPAPSDIAVAQTSRVYFSDGTTEMGTFSEINRTIIPSDQIPDSVKESVVASEDSTFYENRGISPRGILRALINNLSGGSRQGGSTITQQYVERYHTGTNTSYIGKVKEMVMAVKIDQELSKDEILSRYLNTIYFGRGAYGIQAAAQAYYGKDAKDLTDAEAAVIVATIPAPTAYDPANNHDKAVQLWDRVIERRVNVTKTLTPAEADALQYPEPIEGHKLNKMGGTNGYLVRQVQKELVKNGISEDELNQGGFTIVTSVDVGIQDNTVKAIDNLPDDRPENNRVGTVTIDPNTGAIKAMYGGPDYVQRSYNDAVDSHMMAGSIFKTFALVAALDDGYSLGSTWPGDSPRTFKGGWEVNNFNDVDYGSVTLTQATTNSVNTAYAALNIEMGPKKTRDMAVKLGLPEDTPGLGAEPSNVLGSASPTVMNMAGAYATLAAKGVRHEPYITQTVTRSDGSVRYEHQDKSEQVIDESVAINATVALQGPPSTGSARYVGKNMSGRPVAGKTGTSQSVRSAWFVGFTPQLVTAVGMFQPSADGKTEESLTPFGGEDIITGGTFPTEVWVDIMKPSLQGQEKLKFSKAVASKKKTKSGTEKTTKKSTKKATKKATTKAPTTTQAPEPTREPTPEPTPEPTTEAPAPEPTQEQPAPEQPTQEQPAATDPNAPQG